MSTGQTGHKPGGVPPKFFMFIGFFFPQVTVVLFEEQNTVTVMKINSKTQGKKEYTPPPWDPSFLGLSPDPEVTEQKKAMVYTIFLGKQGKRVYTIGPERRVYTIEPQTRKKKKRRVSTVVVYTFFFPETPESCNCKPLGWYVLRTELPLHAKRLPN